MTNPIQHLMLCTLMCITLATPITLHVSQHNVPEVSPQEQHRIIQEYTCIKFAVWFEARNQGIDGLIGVISVISNRKNSGLYPTTFCGVVNQKWQFSFKNKPMKFIVNDSEKSLLRKIEELAFAASTNNLTLNLPQSVLFYHSTKIKPQWSNKMTKHIIIKDHIFYSIDLPLTS